MWPICFAVIATVLLTSEARGEPKFHNVAYKNTRPKTANAPYDIHDGPIIQTGDNEFYRYAMAYTKCYLRGTPGSFNETKHKLFASFVQTMHRTGFDCSQIVLGTFAGATGTWGEDCGFKTPKWGQTVNVYKSADLVHWELVQDALQGSPKWLWEDSIIFRPAIVYNKQSKKYVLWLNRLPRMGNSLVVKTYEYAGFVVGTSSTPYGPFTFEEDEDRCMVQMEHDGGADFAILQDDDYEGNDGGTRNRAYILYGAWHHYGMSQSDWRFNYYPDWAKNGHQIAIQELDMATFTHPVGPSTRVTTNGQESPSIFKRNGVYYLVHGNLCCFCERGSDAKVLASRNPLGPFKYVTNLNNLTPARDHIQAQSSGIVMVKEFDNTTKYLWTGDMWFSSKSGFKGDDFQYFQPLKVRSQATSIFS
eukprot:g9554.t1